MIFSAANAAIQHLFTKPFRALFWKTLGLTLLCLAALWLAVRQLFFSYIWVWVEPILPNLPEWAGWFGFIAAIILGMGLAFLLAMLIAPVTALIAGIFLDDIAEIVEKKDFPDQMPGNALPLGRAMIVSVKFLIVVIVANLLALFSFFIPGLHVFVFFIVNGYLLGREYFEFAAMRYHSETDAKMLRSQYSNTVFIAGLIIALFMAIPLLNLLTPLFAATMMVHLHQSIWQKDQKALTKA